MHRLTGKSALLASAATLLFLSPTHAQERQAYFGETHVHTGWSFDAYIFGNTHTGPADALAYAKGQPIKHPLGYDIKIETPLDWMGVTDHSEYVGTVKLANTPGSPIAKLPIAQKLIVRNPEDVQRIYLWLGTTITENKPIPELISPEVAGTVWKENIDIADKANEPGKFTAFCSYEWTSTPNNRNMHRNIFFRDCAKVPELPYSSIDSDKPEDLWDWMDQQRQAGNELLAISHNANLSDGHMFPTDVDEKGRPIDAAWAASRDRNERLTEIKQVKGASETHPALSPNDEFANFEILTYLLGDPAGRFPHVSGSYVRQALKDGLSMTDARGYNPYKMGFVGGSDSHNTGVPYRQTNFFGAHGKADGDVKQRMSGFVFAGLDVRLENPAGLTGVWAEENTRASLFDAMQRKETFATSGPRIQVRVFGGPDWSNVANETDWAKVAYAQGVPMGSDLPPLPKDRAPSFIVWSVKDPTSGNLDRIQVVKGWTKHGQSFEKVFDVAWAGNRTPDPFTGVVPPIGSTVNLTNATYTNTIGAVELKGIWTDPEFDPSLDAFYYVRTLEIPTPRWTTIQAAELGIAPPDNVAATVQERAWSSPIWYSPTKEIREAADKGTTVASLKEQGATALGQAALTDLVVGKTTWVKNTVTGEVFSISWTKTGQRLINNVGGSLPQPSEVGDVLHGGLMGSGTAYEIRDDAIVTTLNNTPFEVRVYKHGDKYLAARSNEFGFANYEVVSTPQVLDPLDQQKPPF
ncbi:MAG TPA: DUF3604 domain-containing protein [Rhizobiaceae bacterium]|nr:DUF3604 domain-containing protein [Rhizobiaceae bacterium]